MVWLVEVKQVSVEEGTAFQLASEARSRGVSLALLVVLADQQSPLDRERIRRQALKEYRVMLEVVESVRELLGTVAIFSTTSIEQMVAELPGHFAERMREHGISGKGRQRWAELIEARSEQGP